MESVKQPSISHVMVQILANHSMEATHPRHQLRAILIGSLYMQYAYALLP